MAIYVDPTVLFPFYCKDIKAGNLPNVQKGDKEPLKENALGKYWVLNEVDL